jgi:hypothetical protein
MVCLVAQIRRDLAAETQEKIRQDTGMSRLPCLHLLLLLFDELLQLGHLRTIQCMRRLFREEH